MLVYFFVPLAEPATFRNRHFYVILNSSLLLEGSYGLYKYHHRSQEHKFFWCGIIIDVTKYANVLDPDTLI